MDLLANMRQQPDIGRVIAYSHDAYGLGHIARTLGVVETLVRKRAGVAVLVIAGADKVDGFTLPPRTDLLRLPVARRQGLYTSLGHTDPYGLQGIWAVRGAVIAAATLAFQPHVFLTDQLPLGLGRELRPLFASRLSLPETRFLLSMEDAGVIPATAQRQMRGEWGDTMRRHYDAILVRGDERAIDTLGRAATPDDLRERSRYVGYCGRVPAPAAVARARAELDAAGRPAVVIATGGGGDGGEVVRAYLEMVAARRPAGSSLVVTGPLQDERSRARIEALASLPGVRTVPFLADLPAYLHAADLAITMGGYGTTSEMLASQTRWITIPREKPWGEQMVRAELLQEHGLVRVLPAGEVSEERLAAEVAAALAAPAPKRNVDCGGMERVAAEIIARLPERPNVA